MYRYFSEMKFLVHMPSGTGNQINPIVVLHCNSRNLWGIFIFVNYAFVIKKESKLANTQFEALHKVRVANEDILSGYEALGKAMNVTDDSALARRISMHKKHLGELQERQSALGYSVDGNSLEVVLKEWLEALGIECEKYIELGERALLETYQDALAGWPETDDPETSSLLNRQYREVRDGLEMLNSTE